MRIAIIGGGPAGLRAAEVAAQGGAAVTIYERKPSVGRKFLVAGRGGLNLTNTAPLPAFAARYSGDGQPTDFWTSTLSEFDQEALRKWAGELGIETIVATSGRVYPREMKSAPLLRRWVQRLRAGRVEFAMRHRWDGLVAGSPLELRFDTGGVPATVHAEAVILAMGGGSWPETGSDGGWAAHLEALGIGVNPLQAANCGWEHAWPVSVLRAAEGMPLKSIAVKAEDLVVRGELLVTRYGLEGGAIYELGRHLRAMPSPEIRIDFKPELSEQKLVAKLGPIRRNFLPEARARWRLSDATLAIVDSALAGTEITSGGALAAVVKDCPIPLTRARPLPEAISSAGGVRWSELDENLMVRRIPGLFVAGEMIDWEAPTGGFLLQGCFATGTRAARGALAWLSGPDFRALHQPSL